MILINLLPHREEKRKRRKQTFFIGLGAAAAVGAVIVGLWYAVLQEMISAQAGKNDALSAEIRKLEDQIKDIASLKADIESLKARQKAVEDLQTDRNTPVHLLNELVRQTPDGMYLMSIKQDGQSVMVSGMTLSNERVSEFLRNTAYNSPWLERPELQEIKAVKSQDGKKMLFGFSVRLTLKRTQDVQPEAGKHGAAASAPAAAASGKQP
ncbi:PilN domain-containing protein [Aquabacterium sp.]|uniref:PilN domain-containing protein n=1 Tax=Aquabacterium sp. TaxID=1872578 RepID=UPI0035B25345